MKFQFPEGKRVIWLAYKIDKKYMQPRASHGTHYRLIFKQLNVYKKNAYEFAILKLLIIEYIL
jgi:hypothetical protein